MLISAGKLILSFVYIYLIQTIPTLAQSEFLISYFCENTANYTENSAYQRNLNITLSALPTTNRGYGFYKLSVGVGNDTVNSVALCRGDVNADLCESCLTTATLNLQNVCPNQMEAIVYYDYCLLKYSNKIILGNTNIFYPVYLANPRYWSDFVQFNGALRRLMNQLRLEAATGDGQLKFASGNTSGPYLETIYGLVQCTPDLSKQQCIDCLDGAINQSAVWFYGKVGGRVYVAICNIRYETYQFFNQSALVIPPPSRSIPQPSSSPPPPSGAHFAKWTLKLVIGGGSALLAFVIIIIIFCILKSPSSNCVASLIKHKTEADKNIEAIVMQYGALNMERYQYKDIKKMTNSFKLKLGQGGFGQVFKGMLSDGRLVAVKLLNSSKENGQEFINEVASIGRTSHVNIVTLLGFCFEYKKRALVYEYMPNGSLEKYIHNHVPLKTCDQHIGVTKLYEIALGIACGLDYLHRGCKTRILHLDIKPHNILLDEDFCPKIADFGLAKLYSRKESIVSMLEARGTIGYIAPEVYNKNFGGVSHKSDVYSYGMLLLEIVGGKKNIDVDVGSSRTSEIYFPDWIYNRLQKDDFLLDSITTIEENDYARKMTIVGLWCIQLAPNHRPSIDEVIDMLEGSTDALEVPPKSIFSSPPRLPATIYSTSESMPEIA